MTKHISLGEKFSLPIDVITDKTAILGQSGCGKTTVGVGGFCENLLDLKQQVVILDPKGDWWGIKSSADGKAAGYPVTVFGGLHGDLPIYPESGATVANLIVREGISAVLDVSDFESDGQRHKFTTEFALAFYKAKQRSKSPVLFVIEEADESCPQQMVEPTEARMVGAIKRIAKLGRFCGIGVLMLSQRAADVNKKILSQASILIVMRTWHATDLKAIGSALKDQVTKDLYDEVMQALPGLETGEGFVIAPKLGIKKKVKFSQRRTFDAGETPKVGQTRREVKVLAPVEIEALKASMAAEIEKAKAEDPKALKEKIRDLEKKLSQAEGEERVVEKEVTVTVEKRVPFIPDALRTAIEEATTRLNAALEATEEEAQEVSPVTVKLGGPKDLIGGRETATRPVQGSDYWMEQKQKRSRSRVDSRVEKNGSIYGGSKRMLTVLCQFPRIPFDRTTLGILADMKAGTGGYNSALSRLRIAGYIQDVGTGIIASPTGRQAIGSVPPRPSDTDIREIYRQKLYGGSRRMYEFLERSYPNRVTRQDLADAADMVNGTGGFNSALSRLRTLNILDEERGSYRLSPVLFLEGLA